MNKKYAIFDMDGTLVDSMGFWKNLAREFLEVKGVTSIPNDLRERIKPMTMSESAELFVDEFGLTESIDEIVREMNSMMEGHYELDIPLKDGVKEYLEKLKSKGVRMCVASATATSLMENCLKRLGILDYFEFLISCEDVGISKQQPDVYHISTEKFGTVPKDVAVYEDAFYAAKTAKNAGYYTIGVYDENASEKWEKVKSIVDETIVNWREE